jgi:hypothetical protein
MENDTFAVLEIQSNGDDLAIVPPTTFKDWNSALAKFYQTMVSVAQSKVPEHTVMIIDKVGNVNKKETVYHNEDD